VRDLPFRKEAGHVGERMPHDFDILRLVGARGADESGVGSDEALAGVTFKRGIRIDDPERDEALGAEARFLLHLPCRRRHRRSVFRIDPATGTSRLTSFVPWRWSSIKTTSPLSVSGMTFTQSTDLMM
jgi:hypothetical protein